MTPPARREPTERGWELLLLAATALLLLAIEWRQPFYFLQDDNRTLNLPNYLANYRAVSDLAAPLFNFHQLLGTPLLSCVQPASLYPFNYLAILASQLVTGHPFWAIDIVAWFHLAVAAVGTFRLVRHLGGTGAAGFFGAVAWPFCGFVLSVGDSWITTTGFAAWLPWVTLMALRLTGGFDLSSFSAMVAIRALMFFLGFPQTLVYASTFEILLLALVLALRRRGEAEPAPASGAGPAAGMAAGKFLALYALHYAFVFLAILPALLPTIHQIGASAYKSGPLEWLDYSQPLYDLRNWLLGLVYPFAERGFVPMEGRNMHFLSHVGYGSLVFLAAAAVLRKGDEERRRCLVLLVMAAVPLLFASSGTIVEILYRVPLFNRLRWPFRFAFFTSFHLVLLASVGFALAERRAASLPGWPSRAVRLGVPLVLGLHVLNFLCLYVCIPQRNFGVHLDRLPLEEPLREVLRDGRIASVGFVPFDPDTLKLTGYTAPTLAFNYATLWGLHAFGGYETMALRRNAEAVRHLNHTGIIPAPHGEPVALRDLLPLDEMRRWGVRWYVVDRNVLLEEPEGLRLVHTDRWRNLFLDPEARPLAYWCDAQGHPAPAPSFRGNSVEVATRGEPAGRLCVNVLYNPFFRATVDGEEVPLRESRDSQVEVDVPAGTHEVRISYVDPWFRAGLILSGLSSLCTAAFLFRRRTAGAARTAPERRRQP